MLAALRPADDGLTADAMLFAAGRASAKRSHAWPAMVVALSIGLGVALLRERDQHNALEAGLPVSPRASEKGTVWRPLMGTLALRRNFDPDSITASGPDGPHTNCGRLRRCSFARLLRRVLLSKRHPSRGCE